MTFLISLILVSLHLLPTTSPPFTSYFNIFAYAPPTPYFWQQLTSGSASPFTAIVESQTMDTRPWRWAVDQHVLQWWPFLWRFALRPRRLPQAASWLSEHQLTRSASVLKSKFSTYVLFLLTGPPNTKWTSKWKFKFYVDIRGKSEMETTSLLLSLFAFLPFTLCNFYFHIMIHIWMYALELNGPDFHFS